jgi:hypothetical protein
LRRKDLAPAEIGLDRRCGFCYKRPRIGEFFMKRQGYFAACLAAAALVVVPAASALAQGLPMPGIQLGGGKQMSPEEKARQDALEKAARDAQSKIPDQKASNDPWANVRSSETSAPKAGHKAKSTAKSAAKTAH